MFDLRGRRGSEYIVKIINWRVSMENRFLRIYTAFVPFGDMLWIIESYAKSGRTVPEPYLWHTFECLATAGLLMERGEMERNPLSDWTPIVHRDLKLDNIILDQPSKTRFCRYPTPRLADFGAIVYAPKNPSRDTDYYNIAGTPDNFPVKQHPGLSSRVVSSKSNVWGFANIVGSLIWQSSGYEDLNYGLEPGGTSEPSFNDTETRNYSEELRALVLQCMRYDQDDRPDFSTLMRLIRKAKRAGLDRGLEDEPFDGGRWTADSLLVEMKDVIRLTGIGFDLLLCELTIEQDHRIVHEHLDDDEESDVEIGGPPGTELGVIGSGEPSLPQSAEPSNKPKAPESNEKPASSTNGGAAARKKSSTPAQPIPVPTSGALEEQDTQPAASTEHSEPPANDIAEGEVAPDVEQSQAADQDPEKQQHPEEQQHTEEQQHV